MKKTSDYNGLKSQLNTFAKFVFIYEERIRYYNNMQEFNLISSSALSFFTHKLQYKMKYATKDEIKNLTDFTKYSLYFTKSKVQILDFCRHLRNSFAHGNLKKKNKTLVIEDVSNKSKNNGSTYTSFGSLDFEIVKNFIILIINDYEA